MARTRFLPVLLSLILLCVSVTACGTPAPEVTPTPEATASVGGGQCDSPDCDVTQTRTIWFLGEDGVWFSEDRLLEWPPLNTSTEEFSIEELLRGSESGYRIVPEGCALRSIHIQDGLCSITLDVSFPFEDGADSIAAQSIAKTLFQYDYIQSILLSDSDGNYCVEMDRP